MLESAADSSYGEVLLASEKYNLGSASLKQLSADFTRNHHAIFRQLVRPAGLRLIQDEVERLRQDAVRKDFRMECMDFSPRRMHTLGGNVIDRLSSLIPGLYRDPYLIEAISSVCGESVVPLVGDVDRYVVNILARESDTFGAHYDDYPISVVVIVEAPDPIHGGCPELVPRADSLSELKCDRKLILSLQSGDIYMLKSDTTAHLVSPLKLNVERIAINLAYTTPGFRIHLTESASLLYSREKTESHRAAESHNEWDTLEEVIVGVADHAMFPYEDRRMIEATMPPEHWDLFTADRPFPEEIVTAATAELDQLARILEHEGVTVKRPEQLNWDTLRGHSASNPRDSVLIVGKTLIEAPMAWRSRQAETLAYRTILQDYQKAGSRWISAPRTFNTDQHLQTHRDERRTTTPPVWAINNSHPAFDAADFLRFGRDIVAQRSHVTNDAGIEWLRRTLGEEYQVHTLPFNDPHAMHIDASIMPLRPGLMLVNPERVDIPLLRRTLFARWEIVPAPQPQPRTQPPLYMTSAWVNMNLLVIDDNRALVESQDDDMAKMLESLGFTPIACPFRNVQSLGGSFHCATLDTRRRGVLESYL
jgi:glycine amidinotransferase